MASGSREHSWTYDPTLSVEHRRCYSSILAAFPWRWEGIISAPYALEDLTEKIPEYRHFIRSLHDFESLLFTTKSTQATSDILHLLGARIEYPPFPQPPQVLSTHKKELTAVEYQTIASVIAAYAFVEVLALRANIVPRNPSISPSAVMYLPPSSGKIQENLYGMDELPNGWFNLLFEFRRMMNRIQVTDDDMEVLKTGNSLVTLLRMVARNNTRNDYHRVENNLLHAALHMNAMKSVVFPPDQVPDLPKEVHKSKYLCHLDESLTQGNVSEDPLPFDALSQDPSIMEEIRLATSVSNVGPGMFKNAFQVADILSPLLLLRPKQLVKISLHRRNVLELAAKIRPSKSELLLRVEEKVWDALFSLVQAKVTPLEVLRTLLKAIPWSEVEAADAVARAYSEVASEDSSPVCPSSGPPSLPTMDLPPEIQDIRDKSPLSFPITDISLPMTSSFDCLQVSPLPSTSVVLSGQTENIGMGRAEDGPLSQLQQNFTSSLLHEEHDQLDTCGMVVDNTRSTSGPSSSDGDIRMGDPQDSVCNEQLKLVSSLSHSGVQSVDLPGEAIRADASLADQAHSAISNMTSTQATDLEMPSSRTSETLSQKNRVDTDHMALDDIHSPLVSFPAVDSDVPSGGTSTTPPEDNQAGTAEMVVGNTQSALASSSSSCGDVRMGNPEDDLGSKEGSKRVLLSSHPSVRIVDLLANAPQAGVGLATEGSLQAERLSDPRSPQEADHAVQNPKATEPADLNIPSDGTPTIPTQNNKPTLGLLTSNPGQMIKGNSLSVAVDESGSKTKRWTRNKTACVEDYDSDEDEDLDTNAGFGGVNGKVDIRSHRNSTADAGQGILSGSDLSELPSDSDFSDERNESGVLPHPLRIRSKRDRNFPKPPAKGKGTTSKSSFTGIVGSKKGRTTPAAGASSRPAIPNSSTGINSSAGKKSKRDTATALGHGKKRLRDEEGETPDNPIDVDNFHSIFEPLVIREFVDNKVITMNYMKKAPSKVIYNGAFVAYDSNKKKTLFTPAAHHEIFLKCFATFMAKAKKDYVEDKPRFVSDPDTSCLAITDYKDYMKLDFFGKQRLLEGKSAVVVRNWPVPPGLEFNEDGLRTVVSCLSSPVDLLDYSVLASNSRCRPRSVIGTAQDLVKNATPGGRILNGLDFPKWKDVEPNELSVDVEAYDYLRGWHFIDDRSIQYPTSHMNWNLAATTDAITNIHVDADGTFTKNLVACGRKGWGFIKDTAGIKLSSVDFFLQDQFRLEEVLEGCQYNIEFIVLDRGDMLLMKPGKPHFVITLDHSICYGGHLYCTTTMQDTLTSLIHTFVLDRYLTNAVHHPSRLLLRRILLVYHLGLVGGLVAKKDSVAVHLPDVETIDGLMNLLSVCVLVVLGNVLDFRTYCSPNQYDDTKADKQLKKLQKDIDLNAIPLNERKAICYARGVALHVMHWIRSCCIIKSPSGKVVEDLPSLFLVQIANSLLSYKQLASTARLDGAPHCTSNDVRRQVHNLMELNDDLRKMWDKRNEVPSNSLALKQKNRYTLQWQIDSKNQWKARSKHAFLGDGTTAFDDEYFKGYDHWCEQLSKVVVPALKPSSKKPPVKKLRLS